MRKEKYIWIILILFFLTSFGYFFYQNVFPEKSNITEEQTKESMKELEKAFNTEEIIVVFKDGMSEEDMETFIKEMGATIVDQQIELSTYVIHFKNTTTEKLLYILDELNEQDEIAAAVFSSKENLSDDTLPFNDNTIENNKVFESALSNYGQPADVYYSTDGGFTFLYPTSWKATEKSLTYPPEEKQVTYKTKKSPVDLYEDVVHSFIEKDLEQGLDYGSELDVYETSRFIVVKWLMTNGEQTFNKALLQDANNYYYFESNEFVTPEEFNLITDSFYLN